MGQQVSPLLRFAHRFEDVFDAAADRFAGPGTRQREARAGLLSERGYRRALFVVAPMTPPRDDNGAGVA